MASEPGQTGAGRLAHVFDQAKSARRAALIGFLVSGDPDIETTLEVGRATARAGVDILELGIAYGDPLGDGPTVAASSQRALMAGSTVATALQVAERLAGQVPLVLFVYFNLIHQLGLGHFAQLASECGAAGVIVPDVALEEIGDLRSELEARGLAMPLLVAPTTPEDRALAIARASGGFLYLVSRQGVTGGRRGPDTGWVAREVALLRSGSPIPIAVGFGISTPDQARDIAGAADGVVIGSALIDSYQGSRGREAAGRAAAYIAPIANALSRSRAEPGPSATVRGDGGSVPTP